MPKFKSSICRKDIERWREAFVKKKGYLLCSWCLYKLLKREHAPKKKK